MASLLMPVSLAAQEATQSPIARTAADTLARRFVLHRLRVWERFTDDFIMWENRPNFNRNVVSINRWGMRGPDYSIKASPGSYRIALVGASLTLAAGVPLDQTFGMLLEDRLNLLGPGAPRRHYEILNFSVGAFTALQNLVLLDRKVMPFAPKAVLLGVFSVEAGRTTDFLTQLVKTQYPIPFPYVQQRVSATGATPGMEEPELRRRLGAISEDIVRWSYARIAEACRQEGVTVLGLVLPEPRPRRRARWKEDIDQSARLAASAGLPMLDLRDVYVGQNVDSLRLGGATGNDPHWNARGHKLIVDRVFQLMQEKDAQALRLGFKK